MIKNSRKKNEGFVALISTIIITAILLIVLTTLSLSEFYARYNILDSELKRRSNDIAEACADTAILKIANDSTYTGNETENISDGTCTIGPVTGVSTKSFTTQTTYKNYYTNLQIVINSSTFTVISWQEVP